MIALLHAEQKALPEPARKLFQEIVVHLRVLEQQIDDIEKQIVAAVPDASTFRSGRQCAA